MTKIVCVEESLVEILYLRHSKNLLMILHKLFAKLRKDQKFLKERDYYFKTYVGAPTPFIKLENLTDHLGGAQIYAKVVSEKPMVERIKFTTLQSIA